MADSADTEFRFAQCCLPIPDDEIKAVVHSGIGVVVHRGSCKQCDVQESQERVLVKWAPVVNGLFSCILLVRLNNSTSAVAHSVSMLIDMKGEIEELNVQHDKGRCNLLVRVKVQSVEHLSLMIRSLNQLKVVVVAKREARCMLLLLAQG